MTTYGMQAGGEIPIFSDLTNEYTATIFALAQTISMVTGFVPHAMGPLLDRSPQFIKHTWWNIFCIVAMFNMIGGLVFLKFASAERQNWHHFGIEDDNDDDENKHLLGEKTTKLDLIQNDKCTSKFID